MHLSEAWPYNFLIQEHGSVCLGILNGGEVGLDNINVIGGKKNPSD